MAINTKTRAWFIAGLGAIIAAVTAISMTPDMAATQVTKPEPPTQAPIRYFDSIPTSVAQVPSHATQVSKADETCADCHPDAVEAYEKRQHALKRPWAAAACALAAAALKGCASAPADAPATRALALSTASAPAHHCGTAAAAAVLGGGAAKPWECDECTLLNGATDARCAACGAAKPPPPKGGAAATAAQLAKEEAELPSVLKVPSL